MGICFRGCALCRFHKLWWHTAGETHHEQEDVGTAIGSVTVSVARGISHRWPYSGKENGATTWLRRPSLFDMANRSFLAAGETDDGENDREREKHAENGRDLFFTGLDRRKLVLE